MTTHAKTEEQVAQETLVLSQHPSKAMQQMMDTIDVLRHIYIRETDALSNADTKTFLSMQDEKMKAARNYQDGIQQMLIRKNEMRKVDPTLRQKLENMQRDFSALAKKNADALGRMDRSVERLGNTIRRAAKQEAQKQRSFSYDATGTMRNTENKTVSTGVSETA
ncbi:MAG: hypothetical protein DHS20C02_01370 [Micavibrio sp.]|nr:MAG: hypothetical protein DHS20C02_01370 [Micavibrio sp.]